MNPRLYISKENLVTIMFSVVAIITSFLFPNKYILSFWILFLSVCMLLKAKDNSYLLILFGIIAYVNFSLVISEILGLATALTNDTLSWQNSIRFSEYWLTGAQSLVIMLSVINIFFDKKFVELTVNGFEFELKDNSIIFYVGYVAIILIWAFLGYASEAGTNYLSDTSALYEYCLVIVPILWLYSGNRMIRKVLLSIFIVLYCGKSMLHGDRSSMLPMLIFFYFMCFDRVKIDIKKIIILAIGGILISNIISVYRTLETQEISSISTNLIAKYGTSFFTSDTVSQSYYTSVVVQLTHDKVNNSFLMFFDFVIGVFLGGNYGNADISTIVSSYYINKYGGLYYSWFYFWFGYVGVFGGSLALGAIIRKIFMKNKAYFNVLKLIVIIFSLRWYVYTPFVFFRSVLFVFSSLYFVCWIFDSVCRRGAIIKGEQV